MAQSKAGIGTGSGSNRGKVVGQETSAFSGGRGPSTPATSSLGGGGGIVVSHTRRDMKSYNFTESDLEMIGMTNGITAAAFSIASFIFSFCIDLNKDYIFSESLPPRAAAVLYTMNWVGIPIVICCVIIGIVALKKRSNVIKRVKAESQSAGV